MSTAYGRSPHGPQGQRIPQAPRVPQGQQLPPQDAQVAPVGQPTQHPQARSASVLGLIGIAATLLVLIVVQVLRLVVLAADAGAGVGTDYGALFLSTIILTLLAAIAGTVLGMVGAAQARWRDLWSGIAIGLGGIVALDQLLVLFINLMYRLF